MPQFNPRDLLQNQNVSNIGKFSPEELLPSTKEFAEITMGNNFDPNSSAGAKLRISLSRGDNLQEKRLRLKKEHPEGELQILGKSVVTGEGPDEDVLLFRESPQAQWKFVEPEGFDATDIAEAIAPDAEAIAAEAIAALLSGGTTIPATVGRMAAGAFLGEGAEQLIQTATGTQAQSLGQQVGEAGISGGLSLAGGLAMSPLVAAGNIAGGRGALQVGKEGLDTINAAKAIDPEIAKKFTPGLVTDNPALVLNERQSAALLPGLQRRYRELTEMLDSAVKSNVDPSALSNLTQRVSQSMSGLSDAFLARIGNPKAPASRGGRALQQGVEEYSEGSKQLVDDLYDLARGIQEPDFDFTGIVNIARDLRAGAKGTLDPSVDKVLRELENIRGPIDITNGSVSVTEQIRNAQTQLSSIANVEPGKIADQSVGQATDVLRATKETLENPVGDLTEPFVKAWKNASQAASERFNTLGQASVIVAAKSENPAELVARFARPGQVDNLAQLRTTITQEKWDLFKDSFYSNLIEDPASVSRTLKGFDQETLDVLMPRGDQVAFRKLGSELDRITDIGVEGVVERQITNKNVIGELVESATPQRVRTLMRAANETNNKPMRDSVRAGIFDWTWDGIVSQQQAGLKVNQPLLKSRIKDLQKSGMWRLLTPGQQSVLGNAEIVSRAFSRVIDAGTSIQAAEAAKGISRLESGAVRSFVQAGVISHFYLSGAGRRILIGSGQANSRGQYLRLLGAALSQVSHTEDLSELKEQQ